MDIDVVVAGGGAAGLAAGLRAAQAGCSVVIAEARPHFRQESNTAMSTAMVPAGGSRWQAEAGIEDSPEQFLADVLAKTKGTADPVVSKVLTSVAPDVVDWLDATIDVTISLAVDVHYPGHSAPRCHTVPDRAGRTLHGALIHAAEAHEAITMAVPLELTDLVVEDGAVVGAALAALGGTPEIVRCRAVVLATNGYGGNPELIAQHIPEMAAATYFGGPGSKGDALRLTEKLGADRSDLHSYQGHGSLAAQGVLLTWTSVMHGGIVVNRDGQRFDDETCGYSEYAAKVLAQPDRVAWVIYDERVHELVSSFYDYQELLATDAVRWADDAEGLAAITGIDPEGLQASLDQAQACAAGATDPFGRAFWEAPLSGRLAAVKVTGALFHTQGGLLVDSSARVTAGGEPIPGLYAAGGAAVGMSGVGADGYLAGNGLLAALGLGWVAGRAISEAAETPTSAADAS